MNRFQFGSPLLARELIEMAARRRTYFIRVAYGFLFYLATWLQFHNLLSIAVSQPFALLGHGREMLRWFGQMQFYGILLFMPAMTCGAIAYEKERNSLQLLLLTRMRPWAIIFEKLVSRLIPMFTCLLLGMPLLAFTYSLGGIAPSELWSTMWLLFLVAVTVGSLSLACSAFSRTTAGAFIGTYLSMGGLTLMFLMTCMPVMRASRTAGVGPYSEIMVLSAVMIGTSTILLVMARIFLIARAFVAPRNFLLEAFHGLDRIFRDMNHLTGGIVLVNDDKALPHDEPIAWRETMKKSLGTVRYLFRVLIVLETPMLAMLVLTAGSRDYGRNGGSTASIGLFVTWIICLLMISMKGTGLISSERSRETLDVLLTTPISGAQIVREKFRGLRRLLCVLAVPLLTSCFFQTYWQSEMYKSHAESTMKYFVCGVLSVVTYLPLAGWIAFWVGLKIRSQTRATMVTLGLFIVWIYVPQYFPELAEQSPYGNRRPASRSRLNAGLLFSDAQLLFSPQAIVTMAEERDLPDWNWIVANFAFYGLLALLVRRACIRNADRFLGRDGVRRPAQLDTGELIVEPFRGS